MFQTSTLSYAIFRMKRALVNCQLTPEEEERRRMRRERNKFAAAKCRQKRVDLTNELLAVSVITVRRFLISDYVHM